MKHKTKSFLYRVEMTNQHGKRLKHVAEVNADCDENARRQIIHTTMAEGGHVQMITATADAACHPGETAKRSYSD